MENCIVIDLLPSSLSLTEDEWEALLEEEPGAESAGVLTVDLLNDSIADVIMAPALLVELMLENETEVVAEKLAQWLPTRLAAETMEHRPRVRCLRDLNCEVPAAEAFDMKVVAHRFNFQVPPSVPVSACIEPLRLKLQLCAADRGTGSRLWIGGMVLAEWLWQHHCCGTRDVIRDRRVLELGAGFAGLPSQVAKLTGAAHVTATDGVQQCVKGLQRNAAPHGVEIQYLRWGQDECSAVDVVLFADCIYSSRGAELLLQCLDSCRRASPECIIHGTLEPSSRAACRFFLDGMEERGYSNTREELSEAFLCAVRKKLPKGTTDQITADEVAGVQVRTWHMSSC